MKLVNVALEIRDTKQVFESSFEQEWFEVKSMLPQIVRNFTKDEIILFACSYGTLFTVKQGSKIFKKGDERIGVLREVEPENGGKWSLERAGTDDSVYIRNVFTNEYLSTTTKSASVSYGGSKKIALATSPGGSECNWIFKYRDPGFHIINSKNSQHLFTAGWENNYMYMMTANNWQKWDSYECII